MADLESTREYKNGNFESFLKGITSSIRMFWNASPRILRNDTAKQV